MSWHENQLTSQSFRVFEWRNVFIFIHSTRLWRSDQSYAHCIMINTQIDTVSCNGYRSPQISKPSSYHSLVSSVQASLAHTLELEAIVVVDKNNKCKYIAESQSWIEWVHVNATYVELQYSKVCKVKEQQLVKQFLATRSNTTQGTLE